MANLNVFLAAIGGMAVVAALCVPLSPGLLRWLAAHCLLQAGALEAYHEYRRDQMARHMEACGVREQEAEGG